MKDNAKLVTLKEFFEEYPITMKGVAKESGISYFMLRQYCCGAKKPSPMTLIIINKAILRITKKLINVGFYSK